MKPTTCRLAWVLSVGLAAGAPAASKPNVVFILADDLGFSDLGCYGGEIQTPNLDALAGGGLRFTQFYNTARCWPTRAALMTGFYAQQVRRDKMPGVEGGGQGTRPNWAPLLSEMLKTAGYRSYHSGKWHIDGKPLDNGFEHSYEIHGGQNNFFDSSGVTDDGEKLPRIDGYYSSVGTADHAIRCLKQHAEDHPNKPFFEYLAFIEPHFPLHALPEDIARYRDVYTVGWDAIRESRMDRIRSMGIVNCAMAPMERELGPPYPFPAAIEQLGAGEINRPIPWSELSDAQRAFQAAKMSIHAAMIDRMDKEIGRVLDQIRAMGAWENTLIFFASDNGASAEIMVRGGGHDPNAPMGSEATYLCLGPGFSIAANTPFRRHKTWVHEGGCSTPFIAHWPAGIKARGDLRHTPSHLIDIVPTILEIAGLSHPGRSIDAQAPTPPGRSLVPLFTRDGAPLHEALWFHHDGHSAIRAGDWKLVQAKDEPWELFNLASDRGEAIDLAKSMPDKAKELEALWNSMADRFRADAQRGAPPSKPRPKKNPPRDKAER